MTFDGGDGGGGGREGVWVVSEKNILQTDFEGVGEIFFTENKYLSWRIMLEKILHRYMSGKNIYLLPASMLCRALWQRGFGR